MLTRYEPPVVSLDKNEQAHLAILWNSVMNADFDDEDSITDLNTSLGPFLNKAFGGDAPFPSAESRNRAYEALRADTDFLIKFSRDATDLDNKVSQVRHDSSSELSAEARLALLQEELLKNVHATSAQLFHIKKQETKKKKRLPDSNRNLHWNYLSEE